MRLPDPREFEHGKAVPDERPSRMDGRRRAVAFAGAVLLHASLALTLISLPNEPVSPPGEMVITVDLAPAVMSSAADATAGAAESAPQEETPPPEPEPQPPEEAVPEPPPPPQQPPEPEIAKEEVTPPPPPAEKAEVVVAPKTPKKEQPRPKPKPKAKESAPAPAARSANTPRAEVGGTGARASPSDLANYIGKLRAALERRKRYPSAAGGASGTASLRFTVNRSGQVTNFTLTKSSGNAALDAATRAMIQGASLPPIPEGLPSSITVGVPVNFRTR